MAAFPDLSDQLVTLGLAEKRRKLLIFSQLVHKATGEKIEEGFRYFRCEAAALLDAFGRRDFEAIGHLPFALDAEGDADTSGLRLDVVYTPSGSLVGAQPVEYQNYNPTKVAEPLILEGEQAKALAAALKELDQTAS